MKKLWYNGHSIYSGRGKTMEGTSIKLTNLAKSYRKHKAVKDLNLEVQRVNCSGFSDRMVLGKRRRSKC